MKRSYLGKMLDFIKKNVECFYYCTITKKKKKNFYDFFTNIALPN